jgi:hypothetical protein
MRDSIMTRTDFGGRYFPDDDDRDRPRNVGLLTIKQNFIQFSRRESFSLFIYLFALPELRFLVVC